MKVYWIERNQIAIAETSDLKTFSSVAEEKKVHLFAIKGDELFTNTDTATGAIGILEEPNIPAEFHEALTYKVIQQGYERKPEAIQLADYFNNKFNEAVAEAKKVANKDYDNSSYSIKGHNY